MIKNKIEDELLNMGFNPIHMGTIYLVEAIYIVYSIKKSVYKINFEKEIYSELSYKFCKNAKTIKSNIIKATNMADIRNFNSKKRQCNDLKLTPKLVIGLVIRKVRK